jgi:hypothetical protein
MVSTAFMPGLPATVALPPRPEPPAPAPEPAPLPPQGIESGPRPPFVTDQPVTVVVRVGSLVTACELPPGHYTSTAQVVGTLITPRQLGVAGPAPEAGQAAPAAPAVGAAVDVHL